MAGKGGYQAPRKPAPVSGPGALSKRTDTQAPMKLPNPAYGEGKDFMEIQRGAPMASEPRPLPPSLEDPPDDPNEPVTAGAPFGAGPGSLDGRPKQAMRSRLGSVLERMAASDPSGDSEYLLRLAQRMGL